VQSRPDELLEVRAILDDPRDQQGQAGPLCDIDRLDRSLVRMDPAEAHEIAAVTGAEIELGEVDPVVDRGGVLESLVPVWLPECDVGGHRRWTARHAHA